MIAVVQSELYRMRTVRSWWLTLSAVGLLCLAAAFIGEGAASWSVLVGVVVFLLGAVGAGQHYQHRTALLLFLARPRRLTVVAGQALTYAAVAAVLAVVTGVGVLADGEMAAYAYTVFGAAMLAAFAVAVGAVIRRPLWIVMGSGLWFVVAEMLIGQAEMPGPFTGYLRGTIDEPGWLVALTVTTALALLFAGRAVQRDVTGGD